MIYINKSRLTVYRFLTSARLQNLRKCKKMNNVNFEINSFSSLKTMVEYGLLLKGMETKAVDGKLVNYIGLKTPEDIKKFLNDTALWPVDCFEWIKSTAKTLYYCDMDELTPLDISNVLSLIIGLSEVGNYITVGRQDMTPENTKLKTPDMVNL